MAMSTFRNMTSLQHMCRSGWSIQLHQTRQLSSTVLDSMPHFDPSEAATLGASALCDSSAHRAASFSGLGDAAVGHHQHRRSLPLAASASSDNLRSPTAYHHHHHSSSYGSATTTFPSFSRNARAAVAKLLQRSTRALEVDFTPAEDGCGGVYFVTGDDGLKLSVFKPTDEEAQAVNNPKGYLPAEITGEEVPNPRHFGAPREVAAYYLDQMYGGFSGVPVTALVTVRNNLGQQKWGSLQEFVSHEDSAENFGCSLIPVDEVHKIGVLDIRLVNNDRHFANILCRSGDDGKLQLTPIDHGAVLPSCFHLDKARFEWMYWKQAKEPFSAATLAHIESLDPEKDAAFLRSMDVDEECVVSMVLATKLLQLGARQGLSLWDIGNAIQRDLFEENEPSLLERAIVDAVGDASSTKEAILESSDDIAVEAVSHALAGVDYLKRKVARQMSLSDLDDATSVAQQ